jgi:hypothetical protein
MDTILQSVKAVESFREQTYVETKEKSIAKSNTWDQLEEGRFALVPMILLFVVCIGAICAATVLSESMVKFAIVVFSTSLVQATIIAVLPVRIITYSAIVATILSIIVAAI